MNKTIVFASDMPSSTLLERERRGVLKRLATGVYTTDVHTEPTNVVKREWHTIVGHLFPEAVITDRSAVTGGPIEGFLYVAHPHRAKEIALPGMTIVARQGAGPLEGDVALPGGLHQASKARALLENTRPSRARRDRPRRTLNSDELADWIDRLTMIDGEERIARYRELIASGFSRTLHYEISGAGRINYQFNDSYEGSRGDRHPVVFILSINLSSH